MLARTPQAAPRPPFAAPAARISEIRNPQSEMKRSAFTLVEMLVAIVIIAILIALLIPALSRARVTANEARVIVEIKSMETAIVAFKTRFGIEPPSHITLFEKAGGDGDSGGDDWDDYSTYTLPNEVARSRQIITRIWPSFDFNKVRDINGDTTFGGPPISLNAGECLVFFLGGIFKPGTPPSLIGFSKNPADPFDRPTQLMSRDGPFMEFQAGRLMLTPDPLDKMYVYLDPLPGQTKPYLYFNSYEGRGYDLQFDVQPTTMSFPYYSSISTSPFTPYKPQSFQIISPGYDGIYGTGGYYDPNDPITSLATSRPTAVGDPNQYGKGEFDNLTNFNGGRLSP